LDVRLQQVSIPDGTRRQRTRSSAELEGNHKMVSPHRLSRVLARHAARLLGAALVVCLGACASTRVYPPAPVKSETVNHRYKIGPLDTLNVVVWRNPELSGSFTVRPDGRISTPLVEDIQAAGKNPADLSREIEQLLSRVIRDPVVTVLVSGFQGNYSDQIRIVGEAAKPQAVAYRQNMTILDVMVQAGGLTDFADGNGAVLVRGSEGGKQYSVRLKDLLKRGDISANVDVKPGDIVIVPQSWF
jgi:polysaccharide export outer membrane protein